MSKQECSLRRPILVVVIFLAALGFALAPTPSDFPSPREASAQQDSILLVTGGQFVFWSHGPAGAADVFGSVTIAWLFQPNWTWTSFVPQLGQQTNFQMRDGDVLWIVSPIDQLIDISTPTTTPPSGGLDDTLFVVNLLLELSGEVDAGVDHLIDILTRTPTTYSYGHAALLLDDLADDARDFGDALWMNDGLLVGYNLNDGCDLARQAIAQSAQFLGLLAGYWMLTYADWPFTDLDDEVGDVSDLYFESAAGVLRTMEICLIGPF